MIKTILTIISSLLVIIPILASVVFCCAISWSRNPWLRKKNNKEKR